MQTYPYWLWGAGLAGLYGEHDRPGLISSSLFSSLISANVPVAAPAVLEGIQVDEVLYILRKDNVTDCWWWNYYWYHMACHIVQKISCFVNVETINDDH